jgi:competence protein ComEC
VLVLAARLPAWRRPGLAVLACVLAAVVAGWKLQGDQPLPPPTGLRLTALDVGQGDGILLQVPGGAVLVDAGPPEADVDGQLRRRGIRRLALLVLTHPHRDHVGGAAEVIEHVHVDRILDTKLGLTSREEAATHRTATENGARLVTAAAGEVFRLGALRLAVLAAGRATSPTVDPNAESTVLLASYGKVDVLLTGDAESDVTLPAAPPPVEIMKVAHHGSSDDGLQRLLQLTHPSVAIISCGQGNDYGHPAPSTLSALAGAPHLTVFRTDLDGNVIVESDGERISTRSEK